MEIRLSIGRLLKRLQRQRREGLEQEGQNGLFPWLPICRARVLVLVLVLDLERCWDVCLGRDGNGRGKREGLWKTGKRIPVRGKPGGIDCYFIMGGKLKNPDGGNQFLLEIE